MKKSMIWLGPAFMGVVIAVVTVAILIATLVLSDDDSTKPTATDIPAITETLETNEATPANVFGG